MSRVLRMVLALVLAAAGTAAQGNEAERRYSLADHGYLHLVVPKGWLDEVRVREPQLPPTIMFRPLEGDPFLVLLTPVWRPGPGTPMPNVEALRERVEQGIERVRPRAVEKEIGVTQFAGASGAGFYFSVTDRAPRPGEFTFLTQGMLRVDDLIVTFTVLSNSNKDALLRDAVAMLTGAVQLPK